MGRGISTSWVEFADAARHSGASGGLGCTLLVMFVFVQNNEGPARGWRVKPPPGVDENRTIVFGTGTATFLGVELPGINALFALLRVSLNSRQPNRGSWQI